MIGQMVSHYGIIDKLGDGLGEELIDATTQNKSRSRVACVSAVQWLFLRMLYRREIFMEA